MFSLPLKRRSIDSDAPCPCGSRQNYGECCGPVIQGEQIAPTPEALMRSRFTAYHLRDADYVRRSWAPETCPQDLTLENGVDWRSLEILDAPEPISGEQDDEAAEGIVEFIAHCELENQGQKVRQSLHERSRFTHVDGAWLYVDGVTPATLQRNTTKPGRNEPCLCGSGKKYKRCCGK